MMRYYLRTLLILLAVGPPILAGAWSGRLAYREHQAKQAIRQFNRDQGRPYSFIDPARYPPGYKPSSRSEPRPMFRFTTRDVLWLGNVGQDNRADAGPVIAKRDLLLPICGRTGHLFISHVSSMFGCPI